MTEIDKEVLMMYKVAEIVRYIITDTQTSVKRVEVYNQDVKRMSFVDEVNLISTNLPSSTFTLDFKTNEDLSVFKQGDAWVWIYLRGETKVYILSKIEEKGDNVYRASGSDIISLLNVAKTVGGFYYDALNGGNIEYTAYDFKKFIKDELHEKIPQKKYYTQYQSEEKGFFIYNDSDFSRVNVLGYAPYGTTVGEYLRDLCVATGAVVSVDRLNVKIDLYANKYTKDNQFRAIPKTRIIGRPIVYEDTDFKKFVTHAYDQYVEKTERIESEGKFGTEVAVDLSKYTAKDQANGIVKVFDKPYYVYDKELGYVDFNIYLLEKWYTYVMFNFVIMDGGDSTNAKIYGVPFEVKKTVEHQRTINEEASDDDDNLYVKTMFNIGSASASAEDTRIGVKAIADFYSHPKKISAKIIEKANVKQGRYKKYGKNKYGEVKYGEKSKKEVMYDEVIKVGDALEIPINGERSAKGYVTKSTYSIIGDGDILKNIEMRVYDGI